MTEDHPYLCSCVFFVDSQLSLYFFFCLLFLHLHLMGLVEQSLRSQKEGGKERLKKKNINSLDFVIVQSRSGCTSYDKPLLLAAIDMSVGCRCVCVCVTWWEKKSGL